MTRREAAERSEERARDELAGRFSALLCQLARVPEAPPGAAWALALAPGAVVGRYTLVREIGRGGFGAVYEARDRELDRAVAFKAVKVAPGGALPGEQLVAEAEAVARLSHPNIAMLLDAGRCEHGPFLVFELLRGMSLADRLQRGPLTPAEAVRIGLEVAKGLAHAQSHGVVHRDLTPANVFLCDEGHVKILDFGMARAFGQQRVEGGTPGYMSPEQRSGAPEDERSDVYALGVLLHRMLAGELPLRADGKGSTSAPELEVAGAPELGPLIKRMLQRDPLRRPRGASAVVAPLASCLRSLEARAAGGVAATAVRRRRRIGAWAVAGLVALMAGGVVAGWATGRVIGRGVRSAARTVTPSIAVLPFADLSPGHDKEFFSDGLADEILDALAQVPELRVPSRTSSFSFRGRNANIGEIGRELRVGAILEGSVRMAENRVRITAQVVDVAEGYRVWGATYERELTDVFAVQNEIARAVARALGVKLLRDGGPAAARVTASADAYTHYLLGRQQANRVTPEGRRRAAEEFEKAVSIDSGYARAWAALGSVLYYVAAETSTPEEYRALLRRALASARKAVDIAPDLPEALSSRGIVRLTVDRDWRGGRADLERALALNPNDADTHRRYGVVLADQGLLAQGVAELRKAVDLDPLGYSWQTLGVLEQNAGHLAAAEAAFGKQQAIAPDSAAPCMGLGRNLLLEGKPGEALALFGRCAHEAYRLWGTAMAQQALGDTRAADAAALELATRYGHVLPLNVAEFHAWRGDHDVAFLWLDRAVADPASFLGMLRFNPFLKSIVKDPRFAATLRKAGLDP